MKQSSMLLNSDLAQAAKHWKYVAPVLTYPKNESQYNALTKKLDQLLDIVSDNEKHPLIGLVDMLSNLIESYDNKHFELIEGNGIDALKYLMDAHDLTQSDLPELGSQGIVSELLKGKRKLNLRQIKALAIRFKVNPSTFIDN